MFEGLTEEQAEKLDHHALIRKYKRQSIIYSPTEPGQSVLVLAGGRVKIKDLTPDGKETILAFIEEGEIFGELSILDGDSRQEYAEAVQDSEVLLLPRQNMLWLMEERSDLALSITKLIGLRRRRIENRLRNILFLPSRERMLRMLAELIESHGDLHGNQCFIRLALSHQELASLIGVTRETVTSVLGHLQADGLIRVQRRKITITNVKGLLEECARPGNIHRVISPTPQKAPVRGEL